MAVASLAFAAACVAGYRESRAIEPRGDSATRRDAIDGSLSVPAHASDLHIAVPCVGLSAGDAATAWRLVEIGHADHTAPAQLAPLAAPDGAKRSDGALLLAVIPAGGTPGASRSWKLERAPKPSGAPGFALRDLNAASVGVYQGEQPVFVYNHGSIVRDDIAAGDARRERACYLHPVWGLAGEVLTDDFPKDHPHHHGLFWAWPHIVIDGAEYDLWKNDRIRQATVRWLHRDAGPITSTLAVENGWFVGDRNAMTERVWIRVYRADEQSRVLDIGLTIIPRGSPVTLRGAEGKSYGGMTARFAPGPRADTVITVPDGPTRDDLPDTRLPWADFTSRFAGAQGPSGAALLVHPDHPDFPPAWLTRHYGPLCVGWPGVNAKTLPVDQPVHLAYRFWIHKTASDVAAMRGAFDAYSAAVKAEWRSVQSQN